MFVKCNFYAEESNYEEIQYLFNRLWQLKNNRPSEFSISCRTSDYFGQRKDGKQQTISDRLRLEFGDNTQCTK